MPSTETLPTLDDPPTMDKPLPPPPPNSLPFPGLHQLLALQNEPKLPPSGLELDETSNRHVEELLRQSLKSAKVNEKLYLVSCGERWARARGGAWKGDGDVEGAEMATSDDLGASDYR